MSRIVNKSRTKQVSKNMLVAVICQVINLAFSFILRAYFVESLGMAYLGINGLFSNIITILSFTELGIGNAIVFNLYKPLANEDIDKIKSLMKLYKNAYRVISVVILVVGIGIVPIIPLLAKNNIEIDEDLRVLYAWFLLSTVCSYWFSYKKAIVTAAQRNYVILLITQIVRIIQIFVQIISLTKTKNFILYLVLQIVFTLVTNIICSIVADKMYPFLKAEAESLETNEKKSIFRNVRDLSFYKIGSVILNGTDNIIVSSFVGVIEVGLTSNYVLLCNACTSFLSEIITAFTASVGNLNTEDETDRSYSVFNKMLFIAVWLYGFASVGLFVLSEKLIPLWLGDGYILERPVVLAMVIGFFVQGVHTVEMTYRTTLGYFKQGRWAPCISAILNLTLSIVLYYIWGLFGIFIATPLARILGIGVVDTILVYKKKFKRNPMLYYWKCLLYVLVVVLIGVICKYVVSLVQGSGWITFGIQIIVLTLVYNGLMCIVFFKSKIMKELGQHIIHMLK